MMRQRGNGWPTCASNADMNARYVRPNCCMTATRSCSSMMVLSSCNRKSVRVDHRLELALELDRRNAAALPYRHDGDDSRHRETKVNRRDERFARGLEKHRAIMAGLRQLAEQRCLRLVIDEDLRIAQVAEPLRRAIAFERTAHA